MDGAMRKPYQGVLNVVRFNWHFYLMAFALVFALLTISMLLDTAMVWIFLSLAAGITVSIVASLFVSHLVYDRSGLYDFQWLTKLAEEDPNCIVNIHAGFDETSSILKRYFPAANLSVLDFFDPVKHTEASIARARKAYPSFEGTLKITTDHLPLSEGSTDLIFNIFALHEVRDRNERISFLKLQAAALKSGGRCIVVEHPRDVSNFFAYNAGVLHFFSEIEWDANFTHAGLRMESKFKITPFVSAFILTKANGNTP